MDAGQWHEARRLLELVHKSQTGFLKTENLLKKVEDQITREDEKRRQNDQVNTLYKQAHGLLRSKNWCRALEKVEEIRKLDADFEDKERIGERAKRELESEEQEVQKQNRLAVVYVDAVRLMKGEKYEEALAKWNEIRAVDPKYPDRQRVHKTARNALTKLTSVKSRFVMSKSMWIGLGWISVMVILIFWINLFGDGENDETLLPTSIPAEIVDNKTNSYVPTMIHSPTPTSTPRPTTPVPTVITYSDLMYDDFDNTAFDGGYNMDLWRVDTWMINVESANYLISQGGGKLTMTIYDDAGLSLIEKHPVTISEPAFFEARLFLDPKTTSREGGLFIQAIMNNGYALCGVFRTGDYAQQIKCYSEFYGTRTETKLGLDGLLPSWHMFRFEINPETMVISYIVDGQQVASFNPSDSIPDHFDDFKSSRFNFVVALDNYGHSRAPVGYIDFARMGNAKDDPLIFFDDFNGPVLDEIYNALPKYLIPNYKGMPDFSFEMLDRSTVLRLRNNLQPEQSVGWQTTTIFPVETAPIRFEVRFNTMVQSRLTSIDGFLTVGLIDGGNKRYNRVDLFAGNYGKDRTFAGKPFAIKDKTWYRLVLTGLVGQEITAALYDDETGKILVETGLGYNTDLSNSGLKIGLAQFMGSPDGSNFTDVAIDWIRLAFISTP
jgi:tetratricopeptide (TPR) repeat protein